LDPSKTIYLALNPSSEPADINWTYLSMSNLRRYFQCIFLNVFTLAIFLLLLIALGIFMLFGGYNYVAVNYNVVSSTSY
ncbi:hypothetical protein MMB29_24710, partial [Salmonella enterica]|nr:hypothetical protein [Salmonella enterica]